MIIGLGYKKRQGKSSTAKILIEKYGFVEYAFATKLKSLIDSIFNFPMYYKQHKEEIYEPYKISYRDACEKIGQFFRESFGSDFWVRKLEEDIDRCKDRNIVISDVRHMDEIAFLKRKGGLLVKITRPIVTVHRDHHISEFGLDGFGGWDCEIRNEGTLADLEKSVDDMINTYSMKINHIKDNVYISS